MSRRVCLIDDEGMVGTCINFEDYGNCNNCPHDSKSHFDWVAKCICTKQTAGTVTKNRPFEYDLLTDEEYSKMRRGQREAKDRNRRARYSFGEKSRFGYEQEPTFRIKKSEVERIYKAVLLKGNNRLMENIIYDILNDVMKRHGE